METITEVITEKIKSQKKQPTFSSSAQFIKIKATEQKQNKIKRPLLFSEVH